MLRCPRTAWIIRGSAPRFARSSPKVWRRPCRASAPSTTQPAYLRPQSPSLTSCSNRLTGETCGSRRRFRKLAKKRAAVCGERTTGFWAKRELGRDSGSGRFDRFEPRPNGRNQRIPVIRALAGSQPDQRRHGRCDELVLLPHNRLCPRDRRPTRRCQLPPGWAKSPPRRGLRESCPHPRSRPLFTLAAIHSPSDGSPGRRL